MVSDAELVGRLREFLRTSDLTTTTTGTVRRKLEEDFGIDLSEKKAFIREQVDVYLQNHLKTSEADDEEGEGNEEEAAAGVKSGEEEEEEEEEEEGEEEDVETSNGKGVVERRSKKQKTEVKKKGGGFTKLCSLSPELQKFVGVPELARTEVVKQLWAHIREKNLQDPSDRRSILCDDTLRGLFGVDRIGMFQMNKALTKHIWPLDSDHAAPVKPPQKQKQQKQECKEDLDEPKRKKKQQKGGTSGFLKPTPLSDALVKFLGTGESALPRSAVVKRIWEYIKQNDLQDPSDKRIIISDEKLRELFDVDTFHGFTVSKLLNVHFIKTEQ
ncbi:upstream activation factor subunit spp27-like isoform X1 [Rhododendron vialii]|uniref:upstream activation factor subunit spp27-like isoform X1 n=1 Tax=Rhododendron vialii TaxID=182163 RepID=UPI00265EB3C7|nr:upstream activation factor subunit spp27-like isoform X1 [Rhododendron vialii]